MERTTQSELLRGFRAAVPVAVGYVPMAMAFGVLATQTGLSVLQAGAMSFFVYAGASQFAALGLLAGGASALAIVLATLVLNFRHFLMSVALSRRLPRGEREGAAEKGQRGEEAGAPVQRGGAETGRSGRAAAGAGPGRGSWLPSLAYSFGITDETFVVASLDDRLTPPYFLGLIVTVYLSWLSGTLIGAGFASLIPPVIARGMGVALYAMFIAILLPGVKKSWINGVVAVAGGLLAWGASVAVPGLASGWRIVIAILAASALGAVIGGDGETEADAAPPAGAAAGGPARPAAGGRS